MHHRRLTCALTRWEEDRRFGGCLPGCGYPAVMLSTNPGGNSGTKGQSVSSPNGASKDKNWLLYKIQIVLGSLGDKGSDFPVFLPAWRNTDRGESMFSPINWRAAALLRQPRSWGCLLYTSRWRYLLRTVTHKKAQKRPWRG